MSYFEFIVCFTFFCLFCSKVEEKLILFMLSDKLSLFPIPILAKFPCKEEPIDYAENDK
jgi:hypothetical protein